MGTIVPVSQQYLNSNMKHAHFSGQLHSLSVLHSGNGNTAIPGLCVTKYRGDGCMTSANESNANVVNSHIFFTYKENTQKKNDLRT